MKCFLPAKTFKINSPKQRKSYLRHTHAKKKRRRKTDSLVLKNSEKIVKIRVVFRVKTVPRYKITEKTRHGRHCGGQLYKDSA